MAVFSTPSSKPSSLSEYGFEDIAFKEKRIVKAFQKEKKFGQDYPHPHIVELLGFCKDPIALVFEFMPGHLWNILESDQKRAQLSLLDRV